MKLNEARIYIDLNEMVADDIILLSKNDTKTDSMGNIITFYEGMPVKLYSDDASTTGKTDNILLEGVAIKYDLKKYANWQHIKWCVRIDWNSFMHESDMKFLQLLPMEIEKQPNDLLALRKYLICFKNQGMDKDSMFKNLEKLSNESDLKTKDVLMELMDFVTGWCNADLSIFD